MTTLYALCVLALLLYGLIVGCMTQPHWLNLEPYAHRATAIVEVEDKDGRWHVLFVCPCERWSYREVYRNPSVVV